MADTLAIEFDFQQDSTLSEPTYPHVSVQFDATATTASHSKSIVSKFIPKSLADGEPHNVKIEYVREFNQFSFIDKNFKIGENQKDFLDPDDAATNWFAAYQVGLLKIFIDDMEIPILVTPLNMGALGIADTYVKNPD